MAVTTLHSGLEPTCYLNAKLLNIYVNELGTGFFVLYFFYALTYKYILKKKLKKNTFLLGNAHSTYVFNLRRKTIFFEPCCLPFGIISGVLFYFVNGFFECHLTIEMGKKLGIADRL